MGIRIRILYFSSRLVVVDAKTKARRRCARIDIYGDCSKSEVMLKFCSPHGRQREYAVGVQLENFHCFGFNNYD